MGERINRQLSTSNPQLPALTKHTSIRCNVTVANTEIQCVSAAGVGYGHKWTLTIVTPGTSTWSHTSGNEHTTSYAIPTITR